MGDDEYEVLARETWQGPLSDRSVIQRCYARLLKSCDGGDASLDKLEQTGVTIEKVVCGRWPMAHGPWPMAYGLKVPCSKTGFTAWSRPSNSTEAYSWLDNQGDRGEAIWIYPSDGPLHASGGRILFLHGGAYVWYWPIAHGLCYRPEALLYAGAHAAGQMPYYRP